MNQGERDELLVQLKLIDLRDKKINVNGLGIIHTVKLLKEFSIFPCDVNINNLNQIPEYDLIKLALKCGISKAGTTYKADSIINNIPVSIKSNKHAPPALVNHTTRPGFEFAAKTFGGSIESLDKIIDEYWELRINKKINEDIYNRHPNSPFKSKKDVLKPFLNHFLFKGTGRSLSKLPAKLILGFTNPLDVHTWNIFDESNAIDLYWDSLIFSLRAKKGMPIGYPNNMSMKFRDCKDSIVKWTRFIDGEYRGALHIRTK